MQLQAEQAYLERMIPLVQQVVHQTRERVFKGNTHVAGKIVSLFEPHTEVIRKGKAAKPTEFGKMVKIQEAERQIVTHYEVYEQRPSDSDLLLPAIAAAGAAERSSSTRRRSFPGFACAPAGAAGSTSTSSARTWSPRPSRKWTRWPLSPSTSGRGSEATGRYFRAF